MENIQIKVEINFTQTLFLKDFYWNSNKHCGICTRICIDSAF
jgi:hypothetical protein